MRNNQFVRICLELLAGIIISVVLCCILIFLGYYKINAESLNEYTVKLFGVIIYEIKNISGDMVGTAINKNMSIIGSICCIVSVIVWETNAILKGKKAPKDLR
ncbi:MAG: LlsX family protein [Clostridiaceae bacterium]